MNAGAEKEQETPARVCGAGGQFTEVTASIAFTLRPWQAHPVYVIASALSRKASILDASDTGTGKTIVAIAACKAAGVIPLVVCPLSVIESWKAAFRLVGWPFADVTNIEQIKRPAAGWLQSVSGRFRWVRTPQAIVVDEVHRYSAPSTQNAKILASAPRPVVMLSASACDSPIHMRAIGHQLGLVAWNDWWPWCGKMGCKRGHFGGLEFRGNPDALMRMHSQIFGTGRGVRVRVAELGSSFPERQMDCIEVPVQNQKAIDDAVIADLEAAKTGLAVTDMLRSCQIAEHQILPAMIEMITDDIAEGNKCVAFVNFRDSAASLAAKLKCDIIWGGQSKEDRDRVVQHFGNASSRSLVVLSKAGGCGLNGLQDLTGDGMRVGYCVPGWSAIDFLQVLGRLHRADSASRCLYRVITAAGTVLTKVHKKLKAKCNRIETINDGDLRPI